MKIIKLIALSGLVGVGAAAAATQFMPSAAQTKHAIVLNQNGTMIADTLSINNNIKCRRNIPGLHHRNHGAPWNHKIVDCKAFVPRHA